MKRALLISAALAASLAACGSGIETTPAAAGLAPGEIRILEVGDEFVVQDEAGARRTSRVTAVNGTLYTVESSNGCTYTAHMDGFGPSTEYSNCGGSTGTQQMTRTGAIFPLVVGNRESWQVTGSDTQGNSWQQTRDCAVVDTARLTLPAGTYDTYRVRCEDQRNVRTFYYSPELQLVVAHERQRRGQAERESWQLVEFRPAGA